MSGRGPLAGIRVIELAGIGPGPFCGMMLADHGAEVIRIDRPGGSQVGIRRNDERDVMLRSRRTLTLDLKHPEAIGIVRRLAGTAQGFFEGFRPGVAERLGLGPDLLLADNPALVYGRMTGWGQDGPFAHLPGHDLNYIATSGILDAIGPADGPPVVPLNLIGDFGGGGLMLAFGMVSAMLAVRNGAAGQVIDCAMAEGASALMAGIWTMRANDLWRDERGGNLLDGGAPFYGVYETADGRHMAVGAIETKFLRRLLQLIGLSDALALAADPADWPALRDRLAARFRERTQAEWRALLEGEESCVTAVTPMAEAPDQPHASARRSFVEVDGVVQPRPAPRFSDTPEPAISMWRPDSAATELLAEIGYDEDERDRLARDGVFGER